MQMQATNKHVFMLGTLCETMTCFFLKGTYPAAYWVVTASELHHS